MTGGGGGFSLIARSPYLRLVAVLLVLLNVVNTVGEYVLAKNVVHAAAHAANKAAFIGSFYGGFFFWVNVVAALLQAFLVSRLVKRAGVRGVLLFFPLLAFGVYAMMAAGVSFTIIRWLKTADNATDYSVMNTGRAMLWLPTSREEKYRAKQAMDTFVVRFGDVIATAVVFTSTALLHLGPAALATLNTVAAVVWIFVAVAVARKNDASQARTPEPALAPAVFAQAVA
jgi:AAA family ATP:ADP antiporter